MSYGVEFTVFDLPDAPQNEVVILPFGEHETVDGGVKFSFSPADANDVISFFKSRGIDLLFDWEHQSIAHLPGFEQFKAPDGRAPAAAWGPELAVNEKGLVARGMKWTTDGAEAVKAGKYRYHSPVLIMDKAQKRVRAIQSVALTNEPRLKNVPALAARSDLGELLNSFGKESTMALKDALVGALGLKTDAGDQEILSAVDSLKEKAGTADTLNGQVTAFKTQVTGHEAKITELQGQITTLTGDKTKLETEKSTAVGELTALKTTMSGLVLDYAIDTGRIAPAAKDAYKALVDKDAAAALTAFKATPVGAAVPVGRMTNTSQQTTTTEGSAVVSPDDTITACKGVEFPKDRLDLHNKAIALQSKNKGMTYERAVELAAAGQA